MRFRSLLAPVAAAGVVFSPVLAAASGRWIHIRVDEQGSKQARVDVQVPLTMVSAVLPTLKTKMDLEGEIDLGHGDVSLDELRAYWSAVKASKDGEYVTIREGGEEVRVAKRRGIVHVDVKGDEGERVKVRIPVPIVDAVLGHGTEIDLDAMVRSLGDVPSGEIVAVDDDESRVRIWIDDGPAPSDDNP